MVSAQEGKCDHQHQPVARQASGVRVVEAFALTIRTKGLGREADTYQEFPGLWADDVARQAIRLTVDVILRNV